MSNENNTLYLLDAYGLIYRSYFAFINHPLTNQAGENISAMYGFFNSLYTILHTYQPEFLVAAFDSRTPTFRHQLYSDYKATREKTPEDLHAQIPHIETILQSLGISCVHAEGFEADDIIASLVKQATQEKRKCVIISNDKDLMQLVNDTVTLLRPDKQEAWKPCGIAEVQAQWNVPPEQMLDLLSLIGDSSDNIPGVKGIGPKTAVKLLEQYHTLDSLYEHLDSITGAAQKKLAAGKDSAYFSKKLITLADTIPLDTAISAYRCAPLHYAEAAQLFYHYELPRLAHLYEKQAPEANRLDKPLPPFAAAQKPTASPTLSVSAEPHIYTKNSGNYTTLTDPRALNCIIDTAIDQGFVAFDCETTGLNPFTSTLVGFSLSLQPGTGVYIPLKAPPPDLGQPDNAIMDNSEARQALKRLWEIEKLTIIMHNGKFDYQVLKASGIVTTVHGILFDTMIAAWLLEPDRLSFGLDNLAEALLGLKTLTYYEVVPKGSCFADVSLELATNYAAEDADITLQLYHRFKPLLQATSLNTLFEQLEMPLLPLLAEMEETGILLKKEKLDLFSQELTESLKKQEETIFSLVGHPFNIASPKQLQEVLFIERKLPTGKKNKTGYSTDISVLEELSALDELPQKILEYRLFSKLKSTYADALPLLADSKGRIHTSFMQTGTATGRLSSRDPNLQNIPIRGEEGRKIRNAFYAGEHCTLISADYAQIELVILAHLSQDANLIRAFQQGIDVHAATAALIFDVPIEMVQADMRRIAKTINFGIIYGMSAFRLANQLRISRSNASEFIKRYFATYSGVRSFMERLKQTAREKGYVETLMGRRRSIADITSSNKKQRAAAERVAINTPIQGSAADIVKLAMLNVDRMLKKAKYATRILLQVHDELILEAPHNEVEAVKMLLKKEMESVMPLSVPLRVTIESGECWGNFH